MKRFVLYIICIVLLGAFVGCETVRGLSKDVGNTARNLSDLLRLGKDIKDVSK